MYIAFRIIKNKQMKPLLLQLHAIILPCNLWINVKQTSKVRKKLIMNTARLPFVQAKNFGEEQLFGSDVDYLFEEGNITVFCN